jgi:hypothetical protein
MARHPNRFDVQVQTGGSTFGIKNPDDVELTPDQVAVALEAFVARIRAGGKIIGTLSGDVRCESQLKGVRCRLSRGHSGLHCSTADSAWDDAHATR